MRLQLGRQRLAWRLAAVIVVIAALLVSLLARSRHSPAPRSTPLGPYRGLGAWIDIYDTSQWDHPASTVAEAARRGVHTLFLETSNFRSEEPLHDLRALDSFIAAAHARHIRVVAWYLPSFEDVGFDLNRALAAIGYETPGGDGFDGFSLDIECDAIEDPVLRTQRALQLAERIRSAVGDSYTLGAIVPDPLSLSRAHSMWDGFPYARLSDYFDVFLPMGYFTFHVHGKDAARTYTAREAGIIRSKTQRPHLPIHVIGGLAAHMDGPETAGFVFGAFQGRAIGGSLYDLAGTGRSQWHELSKLEGLRGPARPG